MTLLNWLLDSDPAIRWQALADLLDAPAEEVRRERARVATEGWGARILDLQGDDGVWEHGALFPVRNGRPYPGSSSEGQPWVRLSVPVWVALSGAARVAAVSGRVSKEQNEGLRRPFRQEELSVDAREHGQAPAHGGSARVRDGR